MRQFTAGRNRNSNERKGTVEERRINRVTDKESDEKEK